MIPHTRIKSQLHISDHDLFVTSAGVCLVISSVNLPPFLISQKACRWFKGKQLKQSLDK